MPVKNVKISSADSDLIRRTSLSEGKRGVSFSDVDRRRRCSKENDTVGKCFLNVNEKHQFNVGQGSNRQLDDAELQNQVKVTDCIDGQSGNDGNNSALSTKKQCSENCEVCLLSKGRADERKNKVEDISKEQLNFSRVKSPFELSNEDGCAGETEMESHIGHSNVRYNTHGAEHLKYQFSTETSNNHRLSTDNEPPDNPVNRYCWLQQFADGSSKSPNQHEAWPSPTDEKERYRESVLRHIRALVPNDDDIVELVSALKSGNKSKQSKVNYWRRPARSGDTLKRISDVARRHLSLPSAEDDSLFDDFTKVIREASWARRENCKRELYTTACINRDSSADPEQRAEYHIEHGPTEPFRLDDDCSTHESSLDVGQRTNYVDETGQEENAFKKSVNSVNHNHVCTSELGSSAGPSGRCSQCPELSDLSVDEEEQWRGGKLSIGEKRKLDEGMDKVRERKHFRRNTQTDSDASKNLPEVSTSAVSEEEVTSHASDYRNAFAEAGNRRRSSRSASRPRAPSITRPESRRAAPEMNESHVAAADQTQRRKSSRKDGLNSGRRRDSSKDFDQDLDPLLNRERKRSHSRSYEPENLATMHQAESRSSRKAHERRKSSPSPHRTRSRSPSQDYHDLDKPPGEHTRKLSRDGHHKDDKTRTQHSNSRLSSKDRRPSGHRPESGNGRDSVTFYEFSKDPGIPDRKLSYDDDLPETFSEYDRRISFEEKQNFRSKAEDQEFRTWPGGKLLSTNTREHAENYRNRRKSGETSDQRRNSSTERTRRSHSRDDEDHHSRTSPTDRQGNRLKSFKRDDTMPNFLSKDRRKESLSQPSSHHSKHRRRSEDPSANRKFSIVGNENRRASMDSRGRRRSSVKITHKIHRVPSATMLQQVHELREIIRKTKKEFKLKEKRQKRIFASLTCKYFRLI